MASTSRTFFGRGKSSTADSARDGFGYLDTEETYLDSACQTLRPQPVLAAMTEYFTEYNACGGRVKYAWGKKVETAVDDTRERVLAAFGLSPRRYACAFTLNTTYGLNLLLQQLPTGRFSRIVTTGREHNAVFLATLTAARRLQIARVLTGRADDGTVDLDGVDLTDALVVVSAMDNVTGTLTAGLSALIETVHRAGGAVIVDAAQAAPHALSALRGLAADALCFSAHKMYGPALGVVVAQRSLLLSLEVSFVGGGQVSAVSEDDFQLLDDPHTRLEPGLQAWAEIIGLGAALRWFEKRRAAIEEEETRLSERLYAGLAELPHLTMLNTAASPVISLVPERVDAHRLAVFLSQARVSVRSGYFCAHHWLQNQAGLPPLVRFSVGAHNTEHDIDRALDVMARMMKGL